MTAAPPPASSGNSWPSAGRSCSSAGPRNCGYLPSVNRASQPRTRLVHPAPPREPVPDVEVEPVSVVPGDWFCDSRRPVRRLCGVGHALHHLQPGDAAPPARYLYVQEPGGVQRDHLGDSDPVEGVFQREGRVQASSPDLHAVAWTSSLGSHRTHPEKWRTSAASSTARTSPRPGPPG
ncbi:phosphate transporter PitA [Babesia caballi]|uniref:Phosphate transporter PitA n=1 Tax=Babesia caballi TaxID=5871 RepID=A0AAV4LYB0_BABCB|nr:phosphate transporter PitA [Babesia caballi]